MQRWVHRQEVGEEVAVRIFEVVDPLDADGASSLRFDGERWGIMHQQRIFPRPCHGTVAPDCCRGETSRQDLLGELLHGYFVVVNVLSALLFDCACPRHDRRYEQGSGEFWNCQRVQRAAGDLGLCLERKSAICCGKQGKNPRAAQF
jgi:hypothetical protein